MKSGDYLIRTIEWRNKCLNWLHAMSSLQYKPDYFMWLDYMRLNRN